MQPLLRSAPDSARFGLEVLRARLDAVEPKALAQALVAESRGSEAVPHYEYCVGKKADWMMPRILLGKLLLQHWCAR